MYSVTFLFWELVGVWCQFETPGSMLGQAEGGKAEWETVGVTTCQVADWEDRDCQEADWEEMWTVLVNCFLIDAEVV